MRPRILEVEPWPDGKIYFRPMTDEEIWLYEQLYLFLVGAIRDEGLSQRDILELYRDTDSRVLRGLDGYGKWRSRVLELERLWNLPSPTTTH